MSSLIVTSAPSNLPFASDRFLIVFVIAATMAPVALMPPMIDRGSIATCVGTTRWLVSSHGCRMQPVYNCPRQQGVLALLHTTTRGAIGVLCCSKCHSLDWEWVSAMLHRPRIVFEQLKQDTTVNLRRSLEAHKDNRRDVEPCEARG